MSAIIQALIRILVRNYVVKEIGKRVILRKLAQNKLMKQVFVSGAKAANNIKTVKDILKNVTNTNLIKSKVLRYLLDIKIKETTDYVEVLKSINKIQRKITKRISKQELSKVQRKLIKELIKIKPQQRKTVIDELNLEKSLEKLYKKEKGMFLKNEYSNDYIIIDFNKHWINWGIYIKNNNYTGDFYWFLRPGMSKRNPTGVYQFHRFPAKVVYYLLHFPTGTAWWKFFWHKNRKNNYYKVKSENWIDINEYKDLFKFFKG